MSNKVNATTREGSPTAQEVYLSVGVALSWWEASEDMLEKLMVQLCNDKEPIALETFRVAPRQSRDAMIKSALEHRRGRVTDVESSAVLDALKKLQKLSSKRNQIAHGHVQQITETVDGNIRMTGNFLASTLNPMGVPKSRETNWKYAHTAAENDKWRDEVRCERGRIMDVYMAILLRDQESRQRVQE